VTNLSSYSLDENERAVLEKGLSFSPTPRVNPLNILTDAVKFCRNLRWREFWRTHPSPTNTNSSSPLKKFLPPSQHEPKPLPSNHPVEIFIKSFLNKLSDQKFLQTLYPPPNLTYSEAAALKKLKKNENIIITKADKGSTVVVLDKQDYISEGLRQLNDSSSYTPLLHDPNPAFQEEILLFLQEFGPNEGLSNSDIAILSPPHFKTPHLYMLPKLHKINHPGRPIVSGINSPTERISALVDHYLKPLVLSLPSFIKDSYHFLELLHAVPIPSDTTLLMATIDVTSLYTSIPHIEGINALKFYLSKRPEPHLPSTNFIIGLAELVLTKNAFSFNNTIFLQTKGTAMGTRMAPSYANLFMGHLETTFLNKQDLKPLLWARYIDDIFVLWPHGRDSLSSFISFLNSSFSVSFTSSVSDSLITFLDINIQIKDNKFITSVHKKPTNHDQYLHFHSCHPSHTKRSIPYSLSIRGHRICNNDHYLKEYTDNLHATLKKRQYPEKLLSKQILPRNAKYTPRIKTQQTDQLNLVTTFFPGAHKIKNILKDLYPIIKNNKSTSLLLPSCPKVSYRRPSNLKDIFKSTRPSLQPTPPPPVFSTCQRPRCKCCSLLKPPDSLFPSRSTTTADCTTTNIIYRLSCNLCPSFYVGKCTTPLNIRINNHRHATKTPPFHEPIPKHAASHSMTFDECFSLSILEALPESATDIDVKSRETAHIWLTRAFENPGLNLAH
jgi:hypothetical protein